MRDTSLVCPQYNERHITGLSPVWDTYHWSVPSIMRQRPLEAHSVLFILISVSVLLNWLPLAVLFFPLEPKLSVPSCHVFLIPLLLIPSAAGGHEATSRRLTWCEDTAVLCNTRPDGFHVWQNTSESPHIRSPCIHDRTTPDFHLCCLHVSTGSLVSSVGGCFQIRGQSVVRACCLWVLEFELALVSAWPSQWEYTVHLRHHNV